MKSWFSQRGYPQKLIETETSKVKFSGQRVFHRTKVEEGVPTFTSTVTGETFKINHKFDCMKKCLIYLLTCNKCRKQYVGQTVDTFRHGWNNYRSNSRKHAHGISCM